MHSSRRQLYQQQLRASHPHFNNNENSSDIDCTAHRVASVTLESDSLSADQPMSFRSKRRKKIPRKEKQEQLQDMDVDEQQRHVRHEHDTEREGCSQKCEEVISSCKVRMDWQHTTENNQFSDALLSEQSEGTSDDADADDEQSDWPELTESKSGHLHHHRNLLQPIERHVSNNKNALLESSIVDRIEHFLTNSCDKELQLDQVYHTSAIKQILRKQSVAVHIVKKDKGSVTLIKKK